MRRYRSVILSTYKSFLVHSRTIKRISSSCHHSLRITECQNSSDSCSTGVSFTQTSVKEILANSVARLEEEKIDESKLQAEYIIANAIGIDRDNLKNVMNNSISIEQFENIGKMIDCKLARMPLQYIIGDWDFHSVKLKLRPPVFIPRPETESLVNIAIKHLENIEKPIVLDIGCGSGAISLSLLNHFPELRCVAMDQSKYAIDLTSENARDLNLCERLHLVEGKATSNGFPALPYKEFDLIVSNPPYVLKKDLLKLQPEIMLYEDLRALDGGIEGLDIIKIIILHGQHLLKEDGCVILEIDPCHRYLLPNWMEEDETTMKISEFYKDINRIDRFVKLSNKNK